MRSVSRALERCAQKFYDISLETIAESLRYFTKPIRRRITVRRNYATPSALVI